MLNAILAQNYRYKTFLNAFNYIDVVIQILAGDLGRGGSGGNYKKDNVVGKRFHVDFS